MLKLRLLAFLCVAAIPAAVEAKLLIHLPFDKDGSDASGAGRDFVAKNGAAVSHKDFQLGGGAATFDGKGAYYNFPTYSPVVGNRARTISLWAQGRGPSANYPNYIFVGWGGIDSRPRIRCELGLGQGSDTQLRVEFNDDARHSMGIPSI
jgi:hypothetical protein